METTWIITEENINKIIARLEGYGRQVNKDIAWAIFRKYYQNKPIAAQRCGDVCEENKPIAAQRCGDVCEEYKCMIWNAGAVK